MSLSNRHLLGATMCQPWSHGVKGSLSSKELSRHELGWVTAPLGSCRVVIAEELMPSMVPGTDHGCPYP